MSTLETPPKTRRRTPDDASEFEREQLRFFLTPDELPNTLATLNPSLAWLPFLLEGALTRDQNLLVSWMARNFADYGALREVVANLRFFGPDTAKLLELRLDSHAANLPPLLVKCWRLVIRGMRASTPLLLRHSWFELAPRIRAGDTSPDLLDRLCQILRPTIRLSGRIALPEEGEKNPTYPWELMSIDYEIEEDFTTEEVLSAWPKDSNPSTDRMLLSRLANTLSAALDDASDAGVENDVGYSISDSDVPSVAEHPQNAHRSGFFPAVRVLASLWERLAQKAPGAALVVLEDWRNRPHKLMRRMVLFASANPIVYDESAADALITLPQGELFLTGARVEVFRLIRARWRSFSVERRDVILHRLCAGPPQDWFSETVDAAVHIDRVRYDILAEMERLQLSLNPEAEAVLQQIRSRRDKWQPAPPEQIGFLTWFEGGSTVINDVTKLSGVADEDLIPAVARLAAQRTPLEGDSWQGLCLSDPDRAVRGLAAAAAAANWPLDAWRPVLWSQSKYSAPETERTIALLLLRMPDELLSSMLSDASWWLDEHAATLSEDVLWPAWDRLADSLLATKDGLDE